MYKSYISSKKGQYHIWNETDNQDAVRVKKENGVLCAVLADGASCARYGRLGAEIACKTVVDYFLKPDRFGVLFKQVLSDVIKYEVMLGVRNALEKAIKTIDNELSIEDCDCTLMALCVDEKTGNYLFLHLGDGVALMSKQDECKVLSAPISGICSNYTDLISSSLFISRTRLFRGSASEDVCFFMATDGASNEIMAGMNCVENVQRIIHAQEWAGLEAFLDYRKPKDDYSFVAIHFET